MIWLDQSIKMNFNYLMPKFWIEEKILCCLQKFIYWFLQVNTFV